MKTQLSFFVGALLAASMVGQAVHAEDVVKQVAPMVQQAPIKSVLVEPVPTKQGTTAVVLAIKPQAQAKPVMPGKTLKKPSKKVKKISKPHQKAVKVKHRHHQAKQSKPVQKIVVKKVIAVQPGLQVNPAQQKAVVK